MILFRKRKKQEEEETTVTDPFLLYTRQRQTQAPLLNYGYLTEPRQETASTLGSSILGFGSRRRSASSDLAFCSEENPESC